MRLTLPQIIMLNHASAVNRKRADLRYEAEKALKDKRDGKKRKKGDGYEIVDDGGNVPDFENMRSEAIVSYVMSGEDF